MSPGAPDSGALARAAELIGAASRPVVLAGLHCRAEDAAWLRALAEALPAPVVTTPQAREVFPGAHPLALGVVRGGEEDDAVLGVADLIVAFGLGPEELGGRPWPYAALVVALSGCQQSGYPFTPLVEVVGDLAVILEELAPRLRGRTRVDWDMGQLARLKRTRRDHSRGDII